MVGRSHNVGIGLEIDIYLRMIWGAFPDVLLLGGGAFWVEQDITAPPFQRDRYGAAIRRWDDLALGTIRRRRYGLTITAHVHAL